MVSLLDSVHASRNLLFVFGFVVFFCRQYRLERELKNRLWKIDYNLLGFERRTSNTSLASAIVSE